MTTTMTARDAGDDELDDHDDEDGDGARLYSGLDDDIEYDDDSDESDDAPTLNRRR